MHARGTDKREAKDTDDNKHSFSSLVFLSSQDFVPHNEWTEIYDVKPFSE